MQSAETSYAGECACEGGEKNVDGMAYEYIMNLQQKMKTKNAQQMLKRS